MTEIKVVMEGINSKGFGFAPKMVMKDQRLDIESKAIYMYFSSYCGAAEASFPKLETILYDLKISKTRYYKYFKPLKDLGYIEVQQRRTQNKDGKWVADSNLYILKQMINTQITVDDTDSKTTQKNKKCNSETIENTLYFDLPQNDEHQNDEHQNEEDNNNNSINSNSINNNSMIDDDELNRRKQLYKEWTGVGRVTPPIVKFLKENSMQLSNQLFDLLLEKAVTNASTNKKIYSYLKTSILNCIKDKEFTLEEYERERNISDKDFRKKPNNGSNSNIKTKKVITTQHNINQTFRKYDSDELEKMLLENQKGKF
ncbi:hypothetical protein [Paraclostridium sordellii]|uniref:hypothetical protein n=1 Tax=Paraclostridium sordellii TaxID=1505 RepID=UPI0005E01856|nr:hypothetical protein [Paeniclostridium sordellii]CEN21276.1 Uncharacterised protein [[Clostridium] sordellii] [Paeniclostridium sordellii]